MDQSPDISTRNADVTDALNNLRISEAALILADTPKEANPWQDQLEDSTQPMKPAALPILDSSLLDHATSKSESESAWKPHVKDVLNEFDPLEQQVAREAWAHSESHPPPEHVPLPQSEVLIPGSDSESPEPPPKDVPQIPPVQTSDTPQPRTSGSNFPSLATLARTFAISSIPRPRPISVDIAKAVPSPATLSSFGSQQEQRPHDSETSYAVSRTSTPGGSRTGSPRPGRERHKEPPFDFQKFLDQMKLKAAEPVAKYLRSFLSNFAKRTFTVNDQVKIINDFLNFISGRMRETDIWRNATEAEFDNAMEGMEKLVMNRLYDFTFTPQVARAIPPRPITADDLERDRVLSQRIALFGWVEEKHLDIPEGEGSKGFLMFAQQELLKMNHYKAPRDKLICILNCCKVIFGLIRHLHREEGADAFVPILIFVVLKANPENLLSNVEFINRFRNPTKLQSEAGYYLSSLMGAVSFIETMDHTSLSNITQEEFGSKVEDAIQALPQSEPDTPDTPSLSAPSTPKRGLVSFRAAAPALSPHAGEESAQPLALSTPGPTLGEDARRLLQKTGDTISKPLSAIGRIFSEALEEAEGKLTNLRQEQQYDVVEPKPHWADPAQIGQYAPHTPAGVGEGGQQVGSYGAPLHTPYKPRVRRVPSPSSIQSSASMPFSPEDTPTRGPFTNKGLAIGSSQSFNGLTPPRGMSPRMQWISQSGSQSPSQHISRTPTPSIDFVGIQEEIDQAHDKAMGAARETLVQIFPGVDNEVVEWVLEANEGDLGKSIEGLLEMSSES